MDRIEIQRRILRTDAFWGIGNTSCHDIELSPIAEKPTEDHDDDGYRVSVDPNTGDISFKALNLE